MKRIGLKLFYYLVVVPVSWLGTEWALRVYHKTHDRIWPEKSTELMLYRSEAIQTMMGMGYCLQLRGNQIWAFNFSTEDFLLAEHEDPKERWKLALRAAHDHKTNVLEGGA
jgi:hypothetical protein